MTNSMQGQGRGFTNAPSTMELPRDWGVYNSVFDVRFSVQQTQVMTLNYALSTSNFGYYLLPDSTASVWLEGPAGFSGYSASLSTNPDRVICWPGSPEGCEERQVWGESLEKSNLVFILAPGEYRFIISSWVDDPWVHSGSTWSFDATFANEGRCLQAAGCYSVHWAHWSQYSVRGASGLPAEDNS